MILQRFALLILSFLVPVITLGADVKVLSWNVYMLPHPIKKSFQGIRNKAIPEFLKDSDYDIMFFQEAFTGGFRKSMIQTLSNKYPHHYYQKRNEVFSVFGSGVFVMSKYPFSIIDKINYKACSGFDCYAEKGTFIVEVQLPSGKMIHFAPTHLNAQRDNAQVRALQIAQIKELFEKTAKPGVPQVLLGDLNIVGGNEEFHQSLEKLSMIAAPIIGEHQTTSARTNDCYKTPDKPQWLDHLWVSANSFSLTTKIEVVPTDFQINGKTCPLSDHHAIASHLAFN